MSPPGLWRAVLERVLPRRDRAVLLDEFDRMAVSDMLTYEQRLGASLAGTRLMAVLLVVFAVTALALGCVGVYGVAASSVRERMRELGVRMAMGRRPPAFAARCCGKG